MIDNKGIYSTKVDLPRIKQGVFDGYLTTAKFLCDGYVIGGANNKFKSLIINDFLCDGYVIGCPILFDGHLIKEKL